MKDFNERKALARHELKKELARREYIEYCKFTGGGKWKVGKHLTYICDVIEKFLNHEYVGKNILIVSMPPQHGKSQAITETLPSYVLGKNKDKRIIISSYSEELAQRFGSANKRKILEHGAELFNLKLSKTSDTNLVVDNGNGSIISRGIMASLTGQPADLFIIDDPIKNRAEAISQTYRNRLWEEFLNSIYTRLSHDGLIILVMTRWHIDDLAGRILSNMNDKCIEINIPLEAETNDILGRAVGEPLFPEIGKDKEWLIEFKKTYTSKEGSMAWFSLMQGKPTIEEGNLIHKEWFNYYDDKEIRTYNKVIMSVDATFKNNENSDYVAIEVWGKISADIYLIDLIRARLDFPETIRAIKYMKNKHIEVSTILIEDKANGSGIISILKKEIHGVVAVNPKDSKIARVNAISPIIEGGNVYLPKDKIFRYGKYVTTIHEFVNECANFPNDKNDDMVDSMSQALNRLCRYNFKSNESTSNISWEDMTIREREDNDIRQLTEFDYRYITNWSDY